MFTECVCMMHRVEPATVPYPRGLQDTLDWEITFKIVKVCLINDMQCSIQAFSAPSRQKEEHEKQQILLLINCLRPAYQNICYSEASVSMVTILSVSSFAEMFLSELKGVVCWVKID